MKNVSFLIPLLFTATIFSAFASAKFCPEDLTRFERTNRCTACDLSSAVLTTNHSKAVLDYANLTNVRGLQINLSKANLRNANLTGAWLTDANFSQADLSGAHFNGAFVRGANFFGAKGLDLSHVADSCNIILPSGKVIDCKD